MISMRQTSPVAEEHRGSHRLKSPVLVSLRTTDGQTISGTVLDLSLGGLMFSATRPLLAGVSGIVQITNAKGKSLTVEGQVVWTKPAVAPRSLCGVRFKTLTETQRYELLDQLYAGSDVSASDEDSATTIHPTGTPERSAADRAYYLKLLRRMEQVHSLAPGDTDRILYACAVDGKPLKDALLDSRVVDADGYDAFMSAVYDVPFVDLRRERPDPAIADAIPVTLAMSQNVIAMERTADRLVIAMADPLDLPVLDLVQMRNRERLDARFALVDDIQRAVSEVYQEAQLHVAVPVDLNPVTGGADESDVEDLETLRKLSDAMPVVSMVDSLLRSAVEDGASDIHLEPWADKTLVRFRLDGVLHSIRTLPKAIYPAVVSRVKIMSRMDITVRQLPQDGRASMRYAHKDFDLRVSSVPTHHGEKIVIRLLEKNPTFKTLSAVGLNDANYALMAPLIRRPHGMILCCGPTGSGKSTTLFSILQEINDGTTNITTIEDPIEYSVDGVNQIEVNVKRGLTFGSALRSLLRQDPDVIYVGEIRDTETAELAVRAALTGHLLLSTLHTNTAVQAIARLADIGVDTALIGASLIAVVGQRLLRVICERCKEQHALDPDERTLLEQMLGPRAELPVLFRGRGCAYCHHTGYRGRMPVHEVIVVDESLRRLIAKGSDSTELNDYVKTLPGFTDLRSDAVARMLAGRTTLQEVVEMTV